MSQRIRRTGAVVTIASRDVLRDPVLMGLLIVLPVYFVGVWGQLVPDDELPVEVADGTATAVSTTTLDVAITGVMSVATAALLLGIAALFLVQRTTAVDGRLRLAGMRPSELVAGRLALLAAIGLVVAGLATAMTLLVASPEHLGWFLVAILLAGGIYAGLGAIAGTLFGRLGGVYVLLFAPLLDIVIVQNPMADAPDWAAWLPGHHPTELAMSALYADQVATGHAVWGLAAFAIVGIGATLALARR